MSMCICASYHDRIVSAPYHYSAHQIALAAVRLRRIVVVVMANDIRMVIEGRAAASTGRGARLRQAARISQRELAQLVGVSQVAIHRWESRENLPTGAHAIAYARALREIAEEVPANV